MTIQKVNVVVIMVKIANVTMEKIVNVIMRIKKIAAVKTNISYE